MFPIINLHQAISNVVDSGTNKHVPGDRIVYGNAEYIYLYNASNSAITAGKYVELVSGASGYSVVVSGGSGVLPVAHCVHTNVATGQYFWGLKRGVCDLALLTGPTAASQAYLYAGPLGLLTPTAPTGAATASLSPSIGAVARAMQEIASASAGGSGQVMVFYVG